jgi:penicillin G amidase
MTPLEKRLRYLLSTLSVLLLLALVVALWGWWRIRRSLPQIEGAQNVAGLSAQVAVERDALGVATISGTNRLDVARATGFVHAQDRFFQMDLLRRTGAGELSELFGERALEIDRKHRLHGFRHLAEKILLALPAEQRAMLDAYTAGVNTALTASSAKPWEYVVLRTEPQSWRAEDSLLVVYAMWFDLQDANARYEQSLRALRIGLRQTGLDFFAPLGDSWDAALDGSTFQPAALPPLRLKPADPATTASGSQPVEPRLSPGSNAFAVSGIHTVTGAAMLANDMHLSLNVPHIWYRAVLKWTDPSGIAHRVAGVTLPGLPAVVAGSNGHIAWGETNSYADTSDVVLVDTEVTAHALYRTPHGWTGIQERSNPIKVKGKDVVPFIARWTEWGPVIGELQDNRYPALRWNAHDAESTNLNFMELETARTVDEAMVIAHRAGMPNENLVVADEAGSIAWTITGTLPRRVGFDGRQPLSWAFGDRKWDGWLKGEEIPVIKIPGTNTPPTDPPAAANAAMKKLTAEGILWTANQRLVGGAALANLGDNGYEGGARATQIRDGLRKLVTSGKKATPADLLAIQLDDRALYLERWQKVLLAVLSDEAVAENRLRTEMRDAVRLWTGRASTDSAAYRLVRSFHQKLADRAFEPFIEKARETYPDFNYNQFHFDDALWRLVQEKPARLLNTAHKSWEELMLAAADDVIAEVDKAGLPVSRFTWGARNTLRMRHPFSHVLPGLLGRFLDMPAEPLPGDNDMPRVQAPDFGASERMVVSPGHENEGILHMPGGQSGNPLSPYYRAGHDPWVKGEPTPFLPGPTQHTLTLQP